MYKKVAVILVMVLGVAGYAAAQAGDSSRVDVHASVGTTVLSGFGRTQAALWVAPHIDYRATERLTVSAGFGCAESLLPQGYELRAYTPSYAPRRQGSRVAAVWAAVEYRISDRLTVWGMVEHLGGFMQPLWMDHSVPLRATAFSGGFAYKAGDAGLLEMEFRIVRDHYGTAPLGFYGHLCSDPFAPEWGYYGSPWLF